MTTQFTGGSTSNLDALSVAGATTLATIPTVTTAQSMVRLNTTNGYGSTNTKIRRFTNVVTNQGSDITYADSATLGGSFTINTSGVYAMSWTTNGGTIGQSFGMSLNTTTPTTNISAIAPNEVIAFVSCPAVGQDACVASTMYLAAGSVVRVHDDGFASSTAGYAWFTIVRVS